jgi:hypothetical protein
MTINLLDLNNDILEIICGKVKQDHLKRKLVKRRTDSTRSELTLSRYAGTQ